MFDVNTKASMGCHSLFHSTAWKEIEDGFIRQPEETYTVSAVFQPELEQICQAVGGPLTDVTL